MKISLAMKNAICSVMRPKANKVHFDLVNVHAQPNACDCGLYAIAYATELVHGCDPALCLFDNMRQHLLCCLGHLSRFLCTNRRRIPIGSKVMPSIQECIYCTCRRVNDATIATNGSQGLRTLILKSHTKEPEGSVLCVQML